MLVLAKNQDKSHDYNVKMANQMLKSVTYRDLFRLFE